MVIIIICIVGRGLIGVGSILLLRPMWDKLTWLVGAIAAVGSVGGVPNILVRLGLVVGVGESVGKP